MHSETPKCIAYDRAIRTDPINLDTDGRIHYLIETLNEPTFDLKTALSEEYGPASQL